MQESHHQLHTFLTSIWKWFCWHQFTKSWICPFYDLSPSLISQLITVIILTKMDPRTKEVFTVSSLYKLFALFDNADREQAKTRGQEIHKTGQIEKAVRHEFNEKVCTPRQQYNLAKTRSTGRAEIHRLEQVGRKTGNKYRHFVFFLLYLFSLIFLLSSLQNSLQFIRVSCLKSPLLLSFMS